MHARNWRITGGIARRLLSLVPFLPALVVASCADSPTAIDTDGDIQVAIVGGNAQTGIVGQMLTAPLVVRVGTVSAPVAGALVNFVVVRGGGQVWAGSALTAANGIARDFWILGTDTDSAQVVEVRAVRPNGTRVVYGTFTATPLADAAVAVERILGPPSAPELQLVTPAPGLRVSDRFGNPVTGHPVVFTVRRGGGSVSDTIATGSNGIALPEWIPGAYSVADSVARIRMRAVAFPATSDSAVDVQTRIYPVTDLTLVVASGDGQTAPVSSPVSVCLAVESSQGRVTPNTAHPGAVTWTNNGGVIGFTSRGIDGDEMCFTLPQRTGSNQFRATIRGMAGEAIFSITGT